MMLVLSNLQEEGDNFTKLHWIC